MCDILPPINSGSGVGIAPPAVIPTLFDDDVPSVTVSLAPSVVVTDCPIVAVIDFPTVWLTVFAILVLNVLATPCVIAALIVSDSFVPKE